MTADPTWGKGPQESMTVSLADVDAKVEALVHQVAELTSTVGKLAVIVESVSASAQRSENAANAAFNAVTALDPRLTSIDIETEVLAHAATDALARTEQIGKYVEACYQAIKTMTGAARAEMPTERNSKPPKSEKPT